MEVLVQQPLVQSKKHQFYKWQSKSNMTIMTLLNNVRSIKITVKVKNKDYEVAIFT
ncbi:hypothetical protein Hanom_Chr14g01309311 [Helianthus anomalus]